MMATRLALVPLFALALAGPAAAGESGCFVVRLGTDTTGVERYTRTDARTEVFQAGRAPRTLQRHFVYDFAKDDVITRMSMVVTPPGSSTPTQTIEASFGPDSMRMKVQSGSAPVQNLVMAMPPGTVVVASSSPWGTTSARSRSWCGAGATACGPRCTSSAPVTPTG